MAITVIGRNTIFEVIESDVLVIGGGMAGLMAAIHAAGRGAKTVLADKGHVGRSGSSVFAAGLINLCQPDDDLHEWMGEIIENGEYLNDQEWVKVVLQEAYPLALELEKWGRAKKVEVLERDDVGQLVRKKSRGNIHTCTSLIRAIPAMEVLRAQALANGVHLFERTMVTNLLQIDGAVAGALGLDVYRERLVLFQTRAVVLAASGCGFKSFYMGHRNLTGEGQVAAYEAGATLRGMDQTQSNTTARMADIAGLALMVAVGGRFINRKSQEFMNRYDPRLGNRANLTRLSIGMAMEIKEGGGPIYMDLSGVRPSDRELLGKMVPRTFQVFASLGIDPFAEPIEWMPAYLGTICQGGGVEIDLNCAANVPGLFAVGDNSCTPQHGTLSIAGLNLAFALVSGKRAGEGAHDRVQKSRKAIPNIGLKEQAAELAERLITPLRQTGGPKPDPLIYRLQQMIMPYDVCYIRREDRLQAALQKILRFREEEAHAVGASNVHELGKAIEVRSMATIAEMCLRSALARRESRGFAYRDDYPETDNTNWIKWVVVAKGKEGMVTFLRDVPAPYVKPPQTVRPYFENLANS